MSHSQTLEYSSLGQQEQEFPLQPNMLRCLGCGTLFEDDGIQLDCPNDHAPALLRSEFATNELHLKPEHNGIYTFADWMPLKQTLLGSSAPISFRSQNLGKKLGLDNLYISFNGYWPERDVFMTTGTFKECEAFTVCSRLPKDFDDVLVLASTGNTARAFARVCSDNNIKLLLVVPEYLLHMLWFKEKLADNVKLLAVNGNGDYFDAQTITAQIATMEGFIPEGGAKNVGRRDGMGTSTLATATTAGRIPDFYFQAIGSGAGAIAAWEEYLRLRASGQFGDNTMKVVVAQNKPFTPIHDAWQVGSRDLMSLDEQEAKNRIAQISAKVIANRNPAYSITGGVFEMLKSTNGDTVAISNQQVREAAKMFLDEEGIDILPPAAVTTAAVIKYAKTGRIGKDQLVQLNVTGGGIQRFKQENHLHYLNPSMILNSTEPLSKHIRDRIRGLFT